MHRDTLSGITQDQEVESRFSPSLIRAVANTAMGRQDVLPFWFGESDQSTPSFIREAAIASLRDGETFYSENLGRPYLRQAISTYEDEAFEVWEYLERRTNKGKLSQDHIKTAPVDRQALVEQFEAWCLRQVQSH